MTPGLEQWLVLGPIALVCFVAAVWSIIDACRKATPAPKPRAHYGSRDYFASRHDRRS